MKPHHVAEVFSERNVVEYFENKVLISLCAGVSIATLETHLRGKGRVLRALPNTAAKVGKAMTVICRGESATVEDLAIAQDIFTAVGRCKIIEERLIDVGTALASSSPAFHWYYSPASFVFLGVTD